MPDRRISVALVASAMLLGCGGGDDGASARESTTAVPISEATTTPQPAAPEAEADVAARKGLRLQRVGSFSEPLYVTAPPADKQRIFVVQQGGKILVVRGGKKLAKPFLDLSSKTSAGGERGLLSMAFAPDYAESGLFYVDYTDTNGDSRVVEYKRASADRADPGSARQILFQRQPEPNHNGGQLQFGPDGLLYIGFGDGGGAGDQHGAHGNGQNLGVRLGKILRIDPRRSGSSEYSVPASNPFLKRSGAKPEIYSYGLRNPWRFSFDRRNGNLVIGDVGQNEVEEIDFVRRGHGKGANFGWRVFEGRRRYTPGESAPGAVKPVIERFHDDGNCSITGGYVVRDRQLADLYGRYVFGDLCRGVIESTRLRAGRATSQRATRLKVGNLSSFGEDARGRVYAVSLDGPVYRIAPR
jgi:glucose/arabinose dehydrogenase